MDTIPEQDEPIPTPEPSDSPAPPDLKLIVGTTPIVSTAVAPPTTELATITVDPEAFIEPLSPPVTYTPPPRVDNQASIAWMHEDLDRSGLVPVDMGAYPVAPKLGAPGYCFLLNRPSGAWKIRYKRRNKAEEDRYGKYSQPTGQNELWQPKDQTTEQVAAATIIFLIEGEKKAAKFKKQFPGSIVFGFGGSSNPVPKGRLMRPLAELLRPSLKVAVIYDADVNTNFKVSCAANLLTNLLTSLYCSLAIFKPPLGKGVDDWLVADPNAKQNLVPVKLDELDVSRKQLFKQLNLVRDKDGDVVLNEFNAKLILASLFGNKLGEDKRLGPILEGQVTTHLKLQEMAIDFVQGWLISSYRKDKLYTALGFLLGRPQDFLQDLVKGLEWDGVQRLDTWALDYFESDDPPIYIKEWGRLLITGLALRILQPGIKLDYVFTLGGPQGIGKSTFFEELAVFDDRKFYHGMTALAAGGDDSNRSQGASLRKAVIVDMAEGYIFNSRKNNFDQLKQFVTALFDEYRPPYAPDTRIEPRGFVLVATTNRAEQQVDPTGSRRFFQIWVKRITRLPYELKLQLLAEVKANLAAILAVNWYDLRVKFEDLPDELREENPHVTSVTELMNIRNQKHDAFREALLATIEAEGLPVCQSSGRLFVTSIYLAILSGWVPDTTHQNLAASFLNGLSQSPTFPYRITKAGSNGLRRPSVGTLKWGPKQNQNQFRNTDNATNQLQGWWLEKK